MEIKGTTRRWTKQGSEEARRLEPKRKVIKDLWVRIEVWLKYRCRGDRRLSSSSSEYYRFLSYQEAGSESGLEWDREMPSLPSKSLTQNTLFWKGRKSSRLVISIGRIWVITVQGAGEYLWERLQRKGGECLQSEVKVLFENVSGRVAHGMNWTCLFFFLGQMPFQHF